MPLNGLRIYLYESEFISVKCYLFVSGHKFEHLWAKIGNDKSWETRTVKLLGITIYNELKFDEHLNNVCLKANRKLLALISIRKFLELINKNTT